MNTTTGQRRRSWLWIPLWAVIAVVVLWCAYWFVAHALIGPVLDGLVASLTAKGGDATCQTGGMAGFPLSVQASCEKVSLNNPSGSLHLTGASAQVPLHRPGEVNIALTGPLLVSLPREPEPVTATWSGVSATLGLWLSGLSQVAARIDALHVEAVALPPITLGELDVSAVPSGQDYRLQLTATDGKLGLVNGGVAATLAFAADLTAKDLGASLGTDPVNLILGWLRAGGTVEIDHFAISADRTKAAAAGDLTLNANGLVSGSIVVTLSGLDTLPATAENVLSGSHDEVQHALGIVKTFGRTVKQGDATTYQFSLRLRNGRVSLGIIPIGRIPALQF